MLNDMPLCVNEVKAQPAKLRTFATVGRAAKAILRCITLTAIAHAQSAVDKHLKLNIGQRVMYGLYFANRQLPGKHDARKALPGKPLDLFNSPVVCLSACVHLNGRAFRPQSANHFRDSHILYENGVNPHSIQFLQQLADTVEF